MAYSDYNDIQKLIKWVTFSATSKVTLTDITNEHIPDADSKINGLLERLYVVPITNSDDVDKLKYISARYAASEIAQILVLQASGDMPNIIREWKKDADSRLEQILSLQMDLPNSTKISSTNSARFYSFCADGDDDNDTPERQWKDGVDQW
ncbi:MAG: hypothetical protein WC934_07640 [Acidithiobacillus sp.]|jgi:hypothetical protein|uniref:hypothetical protein n=1 Tax=Acidithiobacillus sp. TaxID=1872118 RepID=UPI003560CF31